MNRIAPSNPGFRLARIVPVLCLMLATSMLAQAQNATPNSTSATTTTPSVPRVTGPDQALVGPVRVPLASVTPTDIGITLEQGKKYTVMVQGVGSIWGGYTTGVDPLYRYGVRVKPGTVQTLRSVKLGTSQDAFDALATAYSGKLPPFNPAHTYFGLVIGDGKPLTALFVEKDARSYTDNSGFFTVTVYPEPPVLDKPPDKAPAKVEARKATPTAAQPAKVDADVGPQDRE